MTVTRTQDDTSTNEEEKKNFFFLVLYLYCFVLQAISEKSEREIRINSSPIHTFVHSHKVSREKKVEHKLFFFLPTFCVCFSFHSSLSSRLQKKKKKKISLLPLSVKRPFPSYKKQKKEEIVVSIEINNNNNQGLLAAAAFFPSDFLWYFFALEQRI